MADHESVDPLAEFDGMLRAELAAEPSHEFLPRVRERIRLEPEPVRAWRSWFLAPAAAATLALATALWISRVEEVTPPAKPPAPSFALHAAEGRPNPEYRVPNPEYRVPNTEYRVPSTEPRVPEVIVDQRQRAALLSFMRMVNEGRLTEEAFKLTTPPPADIEEQVKTIAVDPVAVSPIVVGGVLPLEPKLK